MDYQLISLLLLVPAVFFGFAIGRETKQFPSEDTMMQLLVRLRTERKMRAVTKEELDLEIEKASRELAGQRS